MNSTALLELINKYALWNRKGEAFPPPSVGSPALLATTLAFVPSCLFQRKTTRRQAQAQPDSAEILLAPNHPSVQCVTSSSERSFGGGGLILRSRPSPATKTRDLTPDQTGPRITMIRLVTNFQSNERIMRHDGTEGSRKIWERTEEARGAMPCHATVEENNTCAFIACKDERDLGDLDSCPSSVAAGKEGRISG